MNQSITVNKYLVLTHKLVLNRRDTDAGLENVILGSGCRTEWQKLEKVQAECSEIVKVFKITDKATGIEDVMSLQMHRKGRERCDYSLILFCFYFLVSLMLCPRLYPK
jgi:hypothetical protein